MSIVYSIFLQLDEKGKFEGIFESLSPVNGLLSGDKVRPVLINSKLPLDLLGKVTYNTADLELLSLMIIQSNYAVSLFPVDLGLKRH